MACPTPFDAFRLATESLSDELWRRASYRDIWLNLIPRGTYKRGTGLTQSTFVVERTEPTADEEEWDTVTSADASETCGVTYNEVEVGFTEATYGPEQFGLSGPVICQDHLIWNFKAEAFLEGYLQQLEKRNKRSITNRLAKRYTDLVPKVVAGPTIETFEQTSLALPQAACKLNQDMLDDAAQTLMEDGATDPNSGGWINLGDSGPIFPLYIGMQMSRDLLRGNVGLRDDYRWASPLELIKRLGATRVLGNFRHVINLFPPRYNYSGGTYTRVNTWVMSNATKGKKAEINPAWRAAKYEGAWVLNPWVMEEEIVMAVNSAAGVQFPVKNYFGEWKFVVGGKTITQTGDCFDPTGKLGRHFAEYKHAIKPVFPKFGRWIVFARCAEENYTCVSCT